VKKRNSSSLSPPFLLLQFHNLRILGEQFQREDQRPAIILSFFLLWRQLFFFFFFFFFFSGLLEITM